MKGTGAEEYTCPECGAELRQVDHRKGKEAWVCPVALQSQKDGNLGWMDRKHEDALIYGKGEQIKV